MNNTVLNIVADANIWGVEQALANLPGYAINLNIIEDRLIDRAAIMDADILLTRSFTKVNESLLSGTNVRFAATATIGDDHYDKAWLEAQGIRWAGAAGSSTGSVVEYMITLLLELHHQQQLCIPETTIGLIGVGRIGSQLADVCRKLGMRVLCNDPPRARNEGDAGFDSLTSLLEQADLISIHTPLIPDGIDCTHHLLGREQLGAFNGRGIVNAARGVCIDNDALLQWLEEKPEHFAALDCWEHEPRPLPQLVQHPSLLIATPHIAGHSLDGKAANTLYAYRALCDYLHIEPTWHPDQSLPPSPQAISIDATDDPWLNLYRAVKQLYPIEPESLAMKAWAGQNADEQARAFVNFRRHYPVRRAWQHAPVHFNGVDQTTGRLADAIGLNLV